MELTRAAFLLDLDGVIADTARLHFLAWKRVADALGLSFDEQMNHKLRGISREESMRVILAENGKEGTFKAPELQRLLERKNAYYVEMVDALSPRDLLPGVSDFLEEARGRGIRLALASSSRNANRVVARLGIGRYFSYIADAARIKAAKPDPEIFLTCARALGTPPLCCAGVEDAPSGIQAIRAAGQIAVGIGAQTLPQKPDVFFADTNGLRCEEILKKMRSRRAARL